MVHTYPHGTYVAHMPEERPLNELAHEARTYLSVIRLTTETLLAKDDVSRAELESILQQVDSLTGIFEEISHAKK